LNPEIFDPNCPTEVGVLDPDPAVHLRRPHRMQITGDHLRQRRIDIVQCRLHVKVVQRVCGEPGCLHVHRGVMAGQRLGQEREAVDPHGRVAGEVQLLAHLFGDGVLGSRRGTEVGRYGQRHDDQHRDDQFTHSALPF